MSVPAYKRCQNKMTIINKTYELLKEVIRLSKNEKILPKKERRFLTRYFLDDALNLFKNINCANDMNLLSADEAKLRLRYQLLAKQNISQLMSQIKFNIEYLNTRLCKYELLFTLLNDIKILLSRWIQSDKKRLKEE